MSVSQDFCASRRHRTHAGERATVLFFGALLASLQGGGCGGDAYLLVQLEPLSTEDPYINVGSLRVTVTRGRKEIARSESPFNHGAAVDLQPIALRSDLQIDIVGLHTDSRELSKGVVSPDIPDTGHTCCVTACFCRRDTYEAGQCACGDRTCRPQCW